MRECLINFSNLWSWSEQANRIARHGIGNNSYDILSKCYETHSLTLSLTSKAMNEFKAKIHNKRSSSSHNNSQQFSSTHIFGLFLTFVCSSRLSYSLALHAFMIYCDVNISLLTVPTREHELCETIKLKKKTKEKSLRSVEAFFEALLNFE